MRRNLKLYPWFMACRSLLFWQAVWFLYFQNVLSGAEAIMLAAIYDIGTLVLEVPSGYMSDRIGRRITLIVSVTATLIGCLLLALGGDFYLFALAQVLLGAGSAFASGTDNALLYDSLMAEGKEDQVAAHEARAWRFTFTGLAISAFIGGFIALYAMHLAFLATAAASVLALGLTLMFREPPHAGEAFTPLIQAKVIWQRLANRGLAWLFALSVAMYVFSHIPFVFGQPFINQVLEGIGYAAETPAVSGTIVSIMMLLSVAAGWFALPLSQRIGMKGNLFIAFAMQVGLILVLAITVHPAALALLLLRMVPDALARPLILAYVQPRLKSSYRATYLSLQSLTGRLILAGTLFVISLSVPDNAILSHADLQTVLPWYVAAGLAVLAGLFLTVRYVKDTPRPNAFVELTAMTDPGRHAPDVDQLPDQPFAAAKASWGLFVHCDYLRVYGIKKKTADRQTLPLQQRLDRLQATRHGSVLALRPLPERQIVTCRDYAVMMCGLLRHKGIPARIRCGFADYLKTDFFHDHWICEYWLDTEDRWARADTQLDPVLKHHLDISFNTLDMPSGRFRTAREAWIAVTDHGHDPAEFGHGDAVGEWYIWVNLARDLLAVNNIVTSDWDTWRTIAKKPPDLTEDDRNICDQLALEIAISEDRPPRDVKDWTILQPFWMD